MIGLGLNKYRELSMPFQRPPLTQLRQSAAADVASSLPGGDGLLRFSNLQVICDVLAGMANLQYGYLDWILMQSVPWTATDEFLYGWAAFFGLTPIAATAAGGNGGIFTGTDGIVIPAGTLIVRSDGETFATTADGTISGGTVIIPVLDNKVGAQGNTAAGSVLTLSSAIPGVNSNVIASVAFTGGADVETQSSLQSRLFERIQNPPQGGAVSDYIEWASAVAGVTRVWVVRNGQGIGTVLIYFMMDVVEAAYGGFPQGTNGVATLETRDVAATGDQLAVANYIYPLQPVTALVYAAAPTANPHNFTIASLNPNTIAIKNAISAAITDLFLREAAADGSTIPLANVNAAINAIPGIIDFIITSPTTDIVDAVGYLATLGTITYI